MYIFMSGFEFDILKKLNIQLFVFHCIMFHSFFLSKFIGHTIGKKIEICDSGVNPQQMWRLHSSSTDLPGRV